MKLTNRGLLVVLAFTLASATPVRADSDGYFCVGKNYLAYQFGLPPAGPHILYIVRFNAAGEIAKPVEVDIPWFQVHGMRCRDNGVDIAAFDAVHTIPFHKSGFGPRTTVAHPTGRPASEWASTQRNLASLSRAALTLQHETIPLMSVQDVGVVLEIVAVADANSCDTEVTTRIVRYRQSRVLQDQVVFRGRGRRECGE